MLQHGVGMSQMLTIVVVFVVYRLSRAAQLVRALVMNAHPFLVRVNMHFIYTVFSHGYKLKIKSTYVHCVAGRGIPPESDGHNANVYVCVMCIFVCVSSQVGY